MFPPGHLRMAESMFFILATVRDYDIVFFPGTLEVLCHEICLLVHRDPRCYVASLFARSSRV